VGVPKKSLEIRRHSLRENSDETLTPQGRDLAKSIGREFGPFEPVFSGPDRLTRETVRAMGLPDPAPRSEWIPLEKDVATEVGWPAPFWRYAPLLLSDTATRRRARTVLSGLDEILRSVPEDGSGLVVTHGGLPELAAVALFPRADHSAWGGPLWCMEGIRVEFGSADARSCEILRVPLRVSRL
jgi:broad specificity phosphatase PhoE